MGANDGTTGLPTMHPDGSRGRVSCELGGPIMRRPMVVTREEITAND